MPDAWAAPVVRALTVAEGATILALLVPATRPLGGLLAAGLFAGYGLLMAAALAPRAARGSSAAAAARPQLVSACTLGRNAVPHGARARGRGRCR